jgi:hypothetical protein
MLTNQQTKLFIGLFEDLSFEIEELGYEGNEEELINEMLDNHLGIFLEDDSQLEMFTAYILKHQGDIAGAVKRAKLYMKVYA